MKSTPETEMIERILRLIKQAGMTAREFTKALGISATSVTEWKKGRTHPSVDHIRKIAAFFDVSTDYIINGREFTRVTVSDETIDELDNEMYDVFTTLTAEHKKIIRDFIKLCLIKADGKKKAAPYGTKKKPFAKSPGDADVLDDFEKRFNDGEFGEFDPDGGAS